MKFTEIRAFNTRMNALFSIALMAASLIVLTLDQPSEARRAHRSSQSRHAGRRLKIRVKRRGSSARRTHVVVQRRIVTGANDMMGRGDLERAYSLYDQAIGKRLSGNAEEALNDMIAAYDVYHDYQAVNGALEPMLLFDLARTAEEAGNLTLARDTYQKCLRLKPGFSEACISLTGLLVREGNHPLALVHARKLAETRPNDPRASMLLSMLLKKTGLTEEAKQEESKARRLIDSGSFDREIESKPEVKEEPSQTIEKPDEEKTAPKAESERSQSAGSDVPIPDRELEGSPE